MLLRISLILMLIVSPVSLAETLEKKLLVCAQISDSLLRLVCFEQLAESLNVKEAKVQSTKEPQKNSISAKEVAESNQPTPPAPTKAQQIETAKVKPTNDPEVQKAAALAKFGNEDKQAQKELIEKMDAKVAKISKSAYGQYIITLENQQIWRQTDKVRLKITQGQLVSIERGVFGSFFMSTERVNKRIRVKRVK